MIRRVKALNVIKLEGNTSKKAVDNNGEDVLR
jgi:hypothetical protein